MIEVVWNVSDIVVERSILRFQRKTVGMLRTFRINSIFCVLRFLDADSNVTDLSLCFTGLHGYNVIICNVNTSQEVPDVGREYRAAGVKKKSGAENTEGVA